MKRKFYFITLSILLSFSLYGCQTQPTWEQNIIYEELDIEGVTKQYEFLFLTDTHMIVMDEADTQQMKENATPRYAEFQNKEGIASADQFQVWIDYANNEAVDAVLLGGDIIDYPSQANIAHFQTQINRLNMPYLYTLGNHDWTYPWDYMSESGKTTYLPMLESFTGENYSIHSLEYDEFIVVAMDNSTTQFSQESLDTFKEIYAKGKPIIVMIHVPLMTQSVLGRAREIRGADKRIVLGAENYGGIYPNEVSTEFMDLIVSENTPVKLVLAGHVHFYDKDYIEGTQPVLQIVGDAGFNGSAIHLTIK